MSVCGDRPLTEGSNGSSRRPLECRHLEIPQASRELAVDLQQCVDLVAKTIHIAFCLVGGVTVVCSATIIDYIKADTYHCIMFSMQVNVNLWF